MNTPRALLIPAALALLTACGGGGDDNPPPAAAQPQPTLLWDATASAADQLLSWETSGRPAWQFFLAPSRPLELGAPASGELCISGTATITTTAASTARLDIGVPGAGRQIRSLPFQAGQTVEIPFNVCAPYSTNGVGALVLTSSPAVRCVDGASNCLGSFSIALRWTVRGSFR